MGSGDQAFFYLTLTKEHIVYTSIEITPVKRGWIVVAQTEKGSETLVFQNVEIMGEWIEENLPIK